MLCRNFGKDILPIYLPECFINMIDVYHNKFIEYQITRIDNTLRIISFDEISEYTVRAKRVIKIDININAENLLK